MNNILNSYIEFAGQLTNFEIFFICVFSAIYFIRFLFDLFFYGRVIFSNDLRIKNSKPSFSVLMTVRNEENNIRNNLPKILTKDYNDFEVVVVDDFSQDQTYTLLGLLREKYKNLRISSLNQEMRHSSKQALNIGFKAAKYEFVLITKPTFSEIPNEWLATFAEKLDKGKTLVVGYSNIIPDKGMYNLLYRIESFFQQFQSFAYIKGGCGFVVDEDNLCFLKQKYFELGGFARQMNEEYVNLELLVNKFIRKKLTSLNIIPDGIVRKNRFITAQKFRELNDKFVRIVHKLGFLRRLILSVDSITKILILPLTLILPFIFPEIILAAGIIILTKAVLHIVIVSKALNRLNEQKIFISSLIYELMAPYYKLYVKWSYISSLHKRRWSNS